MTKIFNKAKEKDKRKLLRSRLTETELIFWGAIKKGVFAPYRIIRQYSVNGFVVDFYIRKFKIAIELDGNIHSIEGAKEHDIERQKIIEKYNITFIRFTNEEVKNDLTSVIKKLKQLINTFDIPKVASPYQGEVLSDSEAEGYGT